MTVSGVQAAGVMGATRRGGGAVQSWVKPTEAPGAAEEAHRRWPEGRSEQGREQCKGCSKGLRAAARSLEICRERFEVGAGDGGAVQVREFFGVDDCLDFLTQPLWHSLEADF